MSRLKRSLVYAGMIGLAVWPALHIALVVEYGVNPWKLAGWGMYSAPQIAPEVRLFGLASGAGAALFLIVGHGFLAINVVALMLRLLFDRVKGFDNTAVEVVGATEGGA